VVFSLLLFLSARSFQRECAERDRALVPVRTGSECSLVGPDQANPFAFFAAMMFCKLSRSFSSFRKRSAFLWKSCSVC
jgi:hypothetical protein